MKSFKEQLENKMHQRNFHIHGAINYNISGKWQRFSDSTTGKRKKDLFVILHDYDRGATFGDWHYPDDWFTYWNSANGRPSADDLMARKEEAVKRKVEQTYERSKREWRAREFWHRFYLTKDAARHPYAVRKIIDAYGAKIVRSWLVVPVHTIDHKVLTLQIIKPNGFKRLWKGTSPKGNMIWLSEELPENYNSVIRVCEGYATGCTIRSITGSPVVCSINANNLLDTVIELRRKYINANIRICADNDKWGAENTGLKYAEQAARLCGMSLHYPVFDEQYSFCKPTDFNDLFVLAGHEIVKKQLIITRR